MNCRRHLSSMALIGILSCTGLLHADGLDWIPTQTRVFAVGVLEWQNSEMWPSFPAAKKNRSDQQFVEYFRRSGVPDNQIRYLQDKSATKKRIDQEFAQFLDETKPGELLVFYYCGHGYRDPASGQTWFANYDAGKAEKSAWNVRSIFAAIKEHFSGDRVLMLADCCNSGALYDYAERQRDSETQFAVLTSSYSHNTSTGNWTFTDSVLAGLRGSGLVDLDGDGVINLQEVAGFAELELAFIEGQKSMFRAATAFPRSARLTKVEQAVKPRVGQRLEVSYEGKWYKSKIIDVDGDRFRVHYVNYDNSWDEWVGPDRLRPYQPSQFAEGDKVQVRWENDKKWYPAHVLKAWYGLHLVRYDGYDSTWDEWVGPSSIKLRTE